MANHPIVHIEFSAQNPQEAAKFYTDLFGWKTEAMQGPGFEYWMFDTQDGRGGGFNQIGPSPDGSGFETKAGTVIVYVETDDIDAALAKAESLGGKTVMPKSEIPGTGWFGIFTDPSGNQVGLYTGGGMQHSSDS